MKKRLLLTILCVLLSTHAIFAQQVNESVNLTKELISISNDLNIAFDSMLSNRYDKEAMVKDLNFIRTRLRAVINNANNVNNPEANLLKKREYETILSIASEYMLSTNGILLYLEDINNQSFLLDAISSYRQNVRILEELKTELSKAYKVKF